MKFPTFLLLGALTAGALAFGGPAAMAAEADASCPTHYAFGAAGERMPRVAEALKRGRGVAIVAIGSSSTEGAGASTAWETYPHRLGRELSRRYPDQTVVVENRGRGGEEASETLARFEQDVLRRRPDLVIWQVGSNDLLGGISFERLAEVVRNGVGRLRAAGIDVVVMDLQYAPRVSAVAGHDRYNEALDHVAEQAGALVFRRYALMRRNAEAPRRDAPAWVATDGLHLTDASYRCVAKMMADQIARTVGGSETHRMAVR